MKALISPNESPVQYISSWVMDSQTGFYKPVYSSLENSCRIAEVEENQFPVAPPMNWVDCPNDCQADEWYYNTSTNQCVIKPNVPKPE